MIPCTRGNVQAYVTRITTSHRKITCVAQQQEYVGGTIALYGPPIDYYCYTVYYLRYFWHESCESSDRYHVSCTLLFTKKKFMKKCFGFYNIAHYSNLDFKKSLSLNVTILWSHILTFKKKICIIIYIIFLCKNLMKLCVCVCEKIRFLFCIKSYL